MLDNPGQKLDISRSYGENRVPGEQREKNSLPARELRAIFGNAKARLTARASSDGFTYANPVVARGETEGLRRGGDRSFADTRRGDRVAPKSSHMERIPPDGDNSG